MQTPHTRRIYKCKNANLVYFQKAVLTSTVQKNLTREPFQSILCFMIKYAPFFFFFFASMHFKLPEMIINHIKVYDFKR